MNQNPHTAPTTEDPIAIWRNATEESGLAYRAWCRARRTDKSEAYAVYVAAADREHAAVDALLGIPSTLGAILGLAH
jgi:hypothetical protein